MDVTRRTALALLTAAIAACGGDTDEVTRAQPGSLSHLIDRYADRYNVPRDLVHRVVRRESNYNPVARNGPYYGLMQIHPQTARTMGFRGNPGDLLEPETNLTYAVKYLRGAWLVSGGDRDAAVGWYARGYYYEAKRQGLLEATSLR